MGGPPGRPPRHGLCVLVLLPVRHPAVLEPDLDLVVAELQPSGHLQPPRTSQVGAEVELLLQLQQLMAGEGRPPPPDAEPVLACCGRS